MGETDELRASRGRLAHAERLERRRVERALHDDVLQALIAQTVGLQLLRGLLPEGSPEAHELVAELHRETRDALDRLRALASEIYPAVLDARGFPDALREAVRGTGARVQPDARGSRRYALDAEAAMYFCCRSILKGVDRARPVAIQLHEADDALSVEIVGADGADLTAGRDLIEAVGGSLQVQSGPDGASSVLVALPAF